MFTSSASPVMLLAVTHLLLLVTFPIGAENENNNTGINKRIKRQSLLVRCPGAPATGGDEGASSWLLFHSAGRGDLKLEYGEEGWDEAKMKRLLEAGFNTSQPTLLYAHAYMQSSRSGWLKDVRRHYDKLARRQNNQTSYNLLLLDWQKYSRLEYSQSVSWAPHVGRVLGEFLEALTELPMNGGYDLAKMHLISYSLSTHIAGLAGRHAAEHTGQQVGQITALDPTGVCFHQPDSSWFASSQLALRPSDARLVVARHYDMGILGSRHPIGGLDIFVNGGKNQPLGERKARRALIQKRSKRSADELEEEELDNLLVFQEGRFGQSHARAVDHEAALVAADSQASRCHELAYECPSYARFLAGECADCGQQGERCYYLDNLGALRYQAAGFAEVRSQIQPPTTRRMYLKTGSGPLNYCLHHYQALVELKPEAPPTTRRLLAMGRLEFDLGAQLSRVGVRNPATPTTYTSLLLRPQRLTHLTRLVPLLDGQRLASERDERELLGQLERFQLNYMSHPLKSARQNLSLRLCSSSPNSLEPLVRC